MEKCLTFCGVIFIPSCNHLISLGCGQRTKEGKTGTKEKKLDGFSALCPRHLNLLPKEIGYKAG